MNTNLIHNILNVAIAIIAIISLPEVTALLPPSWGLTLVAVASVAKTVINVIRDGISGLVKPQPPVQ